MMPPTSIDGTDITGATIDGTDVQEITVDGQTVFTAAAPSPGFVAENDLVAYYELQTNTNDLTAGSSWAADSTDYTLTNNGGDFSGTFQNGDPCARLDPGEKFTNTPVAAAQIPSTSSPFTTTLWVNGFQGANFGDMDFVSYQDAQKKSSIRLINFGDFFGIYNFDNTENFEDGAFSLDTWFHYSVVFTGAEFRLYKDGSLDSTHSTTVGFGNSDLNMNTVSDRAATGAFYYDLRLYNTDLSDSQINQIYQNTQ